MTIQWQQLPLYEDWDYSYSITLEKVNYKLRLIYSDRSKGWTIDIVAPDNNTVVQGKSVNIRDAITLPYFKDLSGLFWLEPKYENINEAFLHPSLISKYFNLYYGWGFSQIEEVVRVLTRNVIRQQYVTSSLYPQIHEDNILVNPRSNPSIRASLGLIEQEDSITQFSREIVSLYVRNIYQSTSYEDDGFEDVSRSFVSIDVRNIYQSYTYEDEGLENISRHNPSFTFKRELIRYQPDDDEITNITRGIVSLGDSALTYIGDLRMNSSSNGISGSLTISGGVSPYSVSYAGIPYGLTPTLNGNNLIVGGANSLFDKDGFTLIVSDNSGNSFSFYVPYKLGNISLIPTLSAEYDEDVKLNISNIDPNATTMSVYREETPIVDVTSLTPLSTVAISSEYQDTTAEVDKNYYYVVLTINGGKYTQSNQVEVSTSSAMSFTGGFTNNTNFNGVEGEVSVLGGNSPFTSTISPSLPSGLNLVQNGRIISIEGTTTYTGIINSTIIVTDSTSAQLEVPVKILMGTTLSVEYSKTQDWQVDIEWPILTGVDQIRLYRATTEVDTSNLPTPIVTLSGTETAYQDTDIITGETYYYILGVVVGEDLLFSNQENVIAAWNPSYLAEAPAIWLDWDSPVTTSGNELRSWGNKGYIGGAFTQTTSAPSPTISSYSGKRTVVFDGVNDYMAMTGTSAGNLFRNRQYGWDFMVVLTVSGNLIFDCRTPQSAARYLSTTNNTGVHSIGTRRSDTGDSTASASVPGALQEMYMRGNYMSWATATLKMRTKASSQVIQPQGTAGFTSNTASQNNLVSIGNRGGNLVAGEYWGGQMALLLIGNTSLPTDLEILKMEGWAAHNLGITAQMAENHPYKLRAP